MKKEYNSPDFEITSLTLRDTLAASTYSAVPEDPNRSGDDSGDDDFGGMLVSNP